jgi:signal transduction histidine kinase
LYDQVRFIIDLYENQIVQKQISIKNNIGENHEATFDLNSFQTIIRNLINNAVKFAPEKSEIHLYSEYRENALLVVIEDQAGGFPESLLADLNSEKRDVFEKNQIQANGLGLQLVKEFTASNKIKFQVENTTLGSRISLFIPV